MSPHWARTITFLWTWDVWDVYLNFKNYVWLAASALCTAECPLFFFYVICDTYLVTEEEYSKNAGK